MSWRRNYPTIGDCLTCGRNLNIGTDGVCDSAANKRPCFANARAASTSSAPTGPGNSCSSQHVRRDKRPPNRCAATSAEPVIRTVRRERLVLLPIVRDLAATAARTIHHRRTRSWPDTRRTNTPARRAAQLESEADRGHLHRNAYPARTARHPWDHHQRQRRGSTATHRAAVWTVMEILTEAGLLTEDRTPAFDT